MSESVSWLSAWPPEVGLAVLLVASALAAMINTMAGGGTLLLLPVLVGLGMPTPIANGTVRLAILVQSATAAVTFHRRGIREYGVLVRLLVPTLVGAGLGSWTATQLDDALLRPVFGVVLAGWAVFLVVRPQGFERPPSARRAIRPVTLALAAAIGFYGGFLQAGVGFPLIALLVFGIGMEAVPANAVKVGLTGAYSCVALVIFAHAGQVMWRDAAVLAFGSMIGAWIGSRWQIRSGAGVVRWFLVVTVVVSGVMMVLSAWR